MSITQINELKQSIWTDFLSRDYLNSGGLEKHIKSGVSGVTSNPAIFKKAIVDSRAYDKIISDLIAQGRDSLDVYEELIRQDITVAARLLHPTYIKNNRQDGFVSIEVDPAFANRVDETIYQAAHIYNFIDSPNVMIKVPGTDAGIEAFRRLIFDGINVNVTLLFSVDQYEKVARAYVKALQNRVNAGRPIDRMASVASFFVSRIDTAVDNELDRLHNVQSVNPDYHENVFPRLKGKAAISNARIILAKHEEIFHGPEFIKLRHEGACPQRLLWASTSAKNPEYDELKYVEGLIAKSTINTLPLSTLDATIGCKKSLKAELELYSLYASEGYMFDLIAAGIDFGEITDKLLDDGIRAFAKSFDELMFCLYARVAQAKGKRYASGDFEP